MSSEATRDTPVEEIWFESDGVRLFAVESGHGRPIILLHGGLATHEACRRFAAPLATRFRIITPDLRASGRSFYSGPLTWDQLADDVAALVGHLGLESAVIGGISFGAGCAVRVALRHRRLTAALVLLHPAFAGSDVGLTSAQQAAMHAMDAAGSRAVIEGVHVLYPLLDTLPVPMRARARATVATYDPASVAASTRFMASGEQPFDSAFELASISAPTLLVPGIDPYHPVEVAELYRHHLTGATLQTSETADFASAIGDFVDRLG